MKHTVKHVTLNNPHDYQCKKYNWWCMQGCKRYVEGECKPNYPMPAIRYGADWFTSEGASQIDSVVIFRHYTDDDYELPEIVTRF